MNIDDLVLVNEHEDYVRESMMDTNPKMLTVRNRLDTLHTLLEDALAIEVILIGEMPEDSKRGEDNNSTLSAIECSLDTAIDKASTIVSRLRLLEERL